MESVLAFSFFCSTEYIIYSFYKVHDNDLKTFAKSMIIADITRGKTIRYNLCIFPQTLIPPSHFQQHCLHKLKGPPHEMPRRLFYTDNRRSVVRRLKIVCIEVVWSGKKLFLPPVDVSEKGMMFLDSIQNQGQTQKSQKR